jgi:L-ascorbate metabolism protein UlaG (beta-lactamase superfamily)
MSPSRRHPPRVTYVGHATVLIDLDGMRILTDPVLRSRVGHLRRHADPPDAALLEGVDAILISHLHHDHLDLPSLRRLAPRTQAIGPAGAEPVLRRAGFKEVVELTPGEAIRIGTMRIAATEAEHGGRRRPLGPSAAAIGFVVTASRSIYFAGDTDLFEGMDRLAPGLDLALLPIWGWGTSLGAGHLDPERAAIAAGVLRPRIAVPIHWGTFLPFGVARRRPHLLHEPAEDFVRQTAARAPQVEVRVLAPGESTEL